MNKKCGVCGKDAKDYIVVHYGQYVRRELVVCKTHRDSEVEKKIEALR